MNDNSKILTIGDLGWTREEATYVRGMFGSFAEDWDDPSMNVYDDGERFEQVRELAKMLDLTTREGEQQARRLLEEHDLPQHMVFGLQRAPITEDMIRRAEARFAELKESDEP